MKKIQYFIAIAAAMLLTATSCDKEDNPAPVDPTPEITVDQITINTGEGGIAAEVSLKQGETLQLKTAVSPADAQMPEILWNSDNEAVATVSPEGVVTAVGKGTCTITVETVGTPSVKATLQVTVTVDETPEEPPVEPGETIPVNDNAVDQSKAEAPRR
jgi:hypothetical protein